MRWGKQDGGQPGKKHVSGLRARWGGTAPERPQGGTVTLPTTFGRGGREGAVTPGVLNLEFSSNFRNVVILSLPWGVGWRSKAEVH